MSTSNVIQQYEIMYSSNRYLPRIVLKNSGNVIGQLSFMPNGSPLPQDNTSIGQTINLYYHMEEFGNIMGLLRNEAPLYLVLGVENGIKTTAKTIATPEK